MPSRLPTRQATQAQTTAALPQPRQLAALGAVLCLYRAHGGGELGGWAQAARAEVDSGMDSDGLRESLSFHDRDGRCCWRLYLLPDSDFLAWDRLASSLPRADAAPSAGIAERLWRRLLSPQWHCSVLRLHAPHASPGFGFAGQALLAASLTTVSELGATVAARIARSERADDAGLLHDCCCERAARAAARIAPREDTHADHADRPYSLIRLNTRVPS